MPAQMLWFAVRAWGWHMKFKKKKKKKNADVCC